MVEREMEGAETAILKDLDRALRRTAARRAIDALVVRLEKDLAARPRAAMVWDTLPLSLFEPEPPGGIRSAWVFILRAGATTGAERHPNSRQRTMSWRGAGDLQVSAPGGWRSHLLSGGHGAPVERRWVSIPENTWHQVVVGDRNWVVVSFHTAAADRLVEERPRPGDPGASVRRRYLDDRPSGAATRGTP